jgi:Zn-finger nucleic acid-binding protein
MNCPKCPGSLVKKNLHQIEMDQCDQCKGTWLDLNELDLLEDREFDQDEMKGTVIFESKATDHKCPRCEDKLKSFHYRLHDLELEICPQHGYWLDENEAQRVMDLMRSEKTSQERALNAEEAYIELLKIIPNRSLLDRFRDFLK